MLLGETLILVPDPIEVPPQVPPENHCVFALVLFPLKVTCVPGHEGEGLVFNADGADGVAFTVTLICAQLVIVVPPQP